ncbi:hypothetical protein C8R43DRAFT_965321 [Mycena crocata]|nr:hypothetical protein C8R43DRAFT_965321 [Mycena crocata]
MPERSMTQIRLKNIITCLAGPINCINILAETFKTPFLESVSKTTESLVTALEVNYYHKYTGSEFIISLMEKTYGLLDAIISLFAKSETGPDLPLSVLDDLAKLMKLNKAKARSNSFFRQGEMSALLKDCNIGLQEALDSFKIEDVGTLTSVADMKKSAEKRHNEVLELIEAMSEGSTSEKASLLQVNFDAAIGTKDLSRA